MSMPYYASAEQIMRDRSEYARKGIARGRSVAVLSYADGILFVAENTSASLHKVSEIYDRIGFAAVGRYNEFENLRVAGIQHADIRGYSYDRRDVTARSLANAYAQTLGAIFVEQSKPYEVELCVAEVGADPSTDQLYRLTYDGTIVDEPRFLVMGGQAEALTAALRDAYRDDESLEEAIAIAARALASVGGDNGAARTLAAEQLEVAILDRARVGRAFRRIPDDVVTAALPSARPATADADAGAETAADAGSGEPEAQVPAESLDAADTPEPSDSASAANDPAADDTDPEDDPERS